MKQALSLFRLAGNRSEVSRSWPSQHRQVRDLESQPANLRTTWPQSSHGATCVTGRAAPHHRDQVNEEQEQQKPWGQRLHTGIRRVSCSWEGTPLKWQWPAQSETRGAGSPAEKELAPDASLSCILNSNGLGREHSQIHLS